MRKPIVAIVGRPNVGKSTLFNRMIGKRIAVVEDIPGLTRDRIYGEVTWADRSFLVVDTGGFQPIHKVNTSQFSVDIVEEVKKQVIAAVEEADILVMLMDAEKGLVPSDVELSGILRKHNKKTFYAVNKIDGPKKEKDLNEFFSIGADLFPVSALNGYGFEELMDSIAMMVPADREGNDIEYPRIAIVGRPNVGKSTLVNSLLGKKRMIVSPVPGTTRDSIDSVCIYYGNKYLIIDTAGIRKKGKMAKSFERYSFIRTLRNIEDCDVALVILDAVDGSVEMDQKIAGFVYEAGRGCIIIINKWDLVDKSSLSIKEVKSRIYKKLWFLHYAPILTISALSKQRMTKLFPLIDEIINETKRKISTHELNNFLKKMSSIQQPPLYRGKRVRLSYITQVGIRPPCFVIFTNKIDGISQGYLRFMENQLRKTFSFKGVPVRIYLKQKKD